MWPLCVNKSEIYIFKFIYSKKNLLNIYSRAVANIDPDYSVEKNMYSVGRAQILQEWDRKCSWLFQHHLSPLK